MLCRSYGEMFGIWHEFVTELALSQLKIDAKNLTLFGLVGFTRSPTEPVQRIRVYRVNSSSYSGSRSSLSSRWEHRYYRSGRTSLLKLLSLKLVFHEELLCRLLGTETGWKRA